MLIKTESDKMAEASWAAAGNTFVPGSLSGFVCVITLEKGNFQPCQITCISCIRENLYLPARDQRENDALPTLGCSLVSVLSSQPAASPGAVSTVYCFAGRK